MKKYKVTITWMTGRKEYNDFIRNMDLGIEGMFVNDSISFTTTTKPNKKMEEKYKKALILASENKDVEIKEIKVTYEL